MTMSPAEVLRARVDDARRAIADMKRAEEREAEESWQQGLAILQAHAVEALRLADSLPCVPHGEDAAAGAAACAAAAAWRTCEFNARTECAMVRERKPLELALQRMADARVPGAEQDGDVRQDFDAYRFRVPQPPDPSFGARLLASLAGHRDQQRRSLPPQPLTDTDALRLVRAFLRRESVAVPITFGDERPSVIFHGSEWLLLMGGNIGVGKSLAACAGLLDFAEKHDDKGGLFVTAQEFADIDGVSPVSLAEAKAVRLLVLDDLGYEKTTDFAVNQRINPLLAARHAARRMTIITTNLHYKRRTDTDPPGIVERYGARIADRMHEGGRLVALIGDSLRGRTT
jgi:hypothetical protein